MKPYHEDELNKTLHFALNLSYFYHFYSYCYCEKPGSQGTLSRQRARHAMLRSPLLDPPSFEGK